MKQHLRRFGLLSLFCLALSVLASASDSLRVDTLLRQVGRYCTVNPDSALWLSDSCLRLSAALDNPILISRTYYLRGVAWKNKSEYEAAESAYQLATASALQVSDSLQAAEGWYGLGTLRRHQGEYASSLDFLNKALQIRRRNKAKPKTIARTYNSIGGVLYTIGDTPGAIDMFRQSLAIHQSIPANARFIASTQANIGGMFVVQEQADSALHYLRSALQYYEEQQNPRGIGASALNLAETHLLLKQQDLAAEYALLALAQFTDVQDIARQGMAYNALAKVAKSQQNMVEAILYTQQSLAIAEQVGRPDNIREERYNLAELYAQTNRWEEAYRYYRSYEALKDSLFNESINAQMTQSQQEIEAFVKDQEIEDLKVEQLRQQRRRTWLSTILILTLAFLLFTFSINRKRQRALQQIQEEQATTQRLLTEKERLLSDLKSAQLKLIQSEKMVSLGQLTAGIAHEINNPINFVTANLSALRLDFEDILPLLELINQLPQTEQPAELLEQIKGHTTSLDLPTLKEEITQLLSSIDNGAERTRKIVQSLGTFSRNTSEQFLPANINEGIQSTLILMRGSMPRNIQLHTDFGQLPDVVCQISRLNQVFLNLLNNAIYAIEGEGEISIQTQALDDKHIEVTISDTGIGMNEKTQQRIFEPFFTTKSVGDGTGLGLSISYGIIKQHLGEIIVTSEPQVGTTFQVVLPIRHETANR